MIIPKLLTRAFDFQLNSRSTLRLNGAIHNAADGFNASLPVAIVTGTPFTTDVISFAGLVGFAVFFADSGANRINVSIVYVDPFDATTEVMESITFATSLPAGAVTYLVYYGDPVPDLPPIPFFKLRFRSTASNLSVLGPMLISS